MLIQQKNKELSELNATKDKFFSIIANDLKSPFNGFLGISKLMAQETSQMSTEEIKDMSNDLYVLAKNLYELLENLLTWSQLQKGAIQFQPEPLNIRSLAAHNIFLIRRVANDKEIKINNYISKEFIVYADQKMLSTILRNLLSNAIKFTNKGGSISLDASIHNEKEIWISVRDNGIGISKSTKEKLFRIDEKVSRPGTEGEPSSGLGLLLCKEFIDKLSGSLWVESEENKGSTFYFTLPSVN
jgi:signal transduction histidine kinase